MRKTITMGRGFRLEIFSFVLALAFNDALSSHQLARLCFVCSRKTHTRLEEHTTLVTLIRIIGRDNANSSILIELRIT
ncbi:hypothetical protein C8R42DRAFT_248765 [Lentinula raphanica]|nr:hypothetical protein C8R42DRAFT_248765 [Lentinula raphanica]